MVAGDVYRCSCPAPMPGGEGPMLVGAIDVHCHILVPEVEAIVAGRPEPARLADEQARFLGKASCVHNVAMIRDLGPRLTNIDTRLSDMDAMGIAVQLLSPSPTQYHYWADPALSDALVRYQNARLAEICAAHPDRFLALGAISMQHPDLALRQLSALMRAGFKGVEISTRIGDRDLADPAFEPFWRAAAAAKAVVFIHPLGTTLGDRLSDHYLSNIIGQPLETTIALSNLILSGTFDRHPQLKIVAAHGGGYLPHFFGRLDHAHVVRPETGCCAERPSRYLSRIWYDTVVHDPGILMALIDTVGASRLLVGTDYPFDMGEYRIAALLDGMPALATSDREAIVHGNARSLLDIAV